MAKTIASKKGAFVPAPKRTFGQPLLARPIAASPLFYITLHLDRVEREWRRVRPGVYQCTNRRTIK